MVEFNTSPPVVASETKLLLSPKDHVFVNRLVTSRTELELRRLDGREVVLPMQICKLLIDCFRK